MKFRWFCALTLILAACGDDTGAVEDGGLDMRGDGAVVHSDGGVADAGVVNVGDSGLSDAGVAIDGGNDADAGPQDDWPLPRPGDMGTGGACAEPEHGPIDPSWPEVFVGVEGCDDGGDGSRGTPFCTFERAFEVADAAPYVVSVLSGTYRQRSHRLTRPGTAEEYFVVRAAPGETPVILGSSAVLGADFEAYGDGLYRADVSALENDPTGFWTASGERLAHAMERRDGRRSHAPVSMLTEPGWTKGDSAGQGCGQDNDGCFIYLRPPAEMDVAATDFEASQGSFFYSGGGHYQVVSGLTVHFTQATAIFFEGARHVLLEDNVFAHNANGDDNAYSLRLWGADGAIVRRNRISDSEYWSGAENSHGVTFMIGGDEAPMWVCENEIFNMNGAAVSTKSGSSQVHVVGNHIHDVTYGVRTPSWRCHWRGCDTRLFPGGGYVIRENLFERCGTGVLTNTVSERLESVEANEIHNNVFADVQHGVLIRRANVQPVIRNNVFVGEGEGLRFQAGGTTTWPEYYFGEGLRSDHNHYAVPTPIYVYANWSGTEEALSLGDYQERYGVEAMSNAGEVSFGPRYRPMESSPLWNTGDAAAYEGATSVHRGLWPLLP